MCRLFPELVEHSSRRDRDLKLVAKYLGKLACLMRIAGSQQQFIFFSCFPAFLIHNPMSSERRQPYPFDQIEPKWQALWTSGKFFTRLIPEKGFDPASRNFTCSTCPVSSGAGLHVGHRRLYATDIIARYKRMCGFAFCIQWAGMRSVLPAEQYAIKSGQHPALTDAQNIAKFKSQLKAIVSLNDWQREINTPTRAITNGRSGFFCRSTTRWFNPKTTRRADSTYRAKILTACGSLTSRSSSQLVSGTRTVLANEEVVDGKSEVGGFSVVRRPMRQWMLRTHRLRRAFD